MCGLIGTNPGKMWLWITSGSGGLLIDSSLLTNTMLVCGALLSLFSGRCGVLSQLGRGHYQYCSRRGVSAFKSQRLLRDSLLQASKSILKTLQ